MTFKLIMDKPRILFLGTRNATLSQMAEALMRKYAGDKYEIYSAGMQPTIIDPITIQVMEEVGCKMDQACSKAYSDLISQISFSLIITVCDDIQSLYTFSPGLSMLVSWNFSDPIVAPCQVEVKLTEFRDLRDQIDHKVVQFLTDLKSISTP